MLHLIDVKPANASGYMMRPGRCKLAIGNSSPMPKLALKLLLTSLVFKRRSKRMSGMQFAGSLLTLALIISVGLYVSTRGPY